MSSHKISSSQRFATTPGPKADEEYGLLADEMKGDFFGPMPVSEFFSSFMQKPRKNPPKGYAKAFKAVPKNGEPGFEDEFIRAVHETELCPQFIFVNTTTRPDANYERKPDISVYRKAPGFKERNTNFRIMELCIERKPENQDPFTDPDPSALSRDEHSFLTDTLEATHHRGQICSYAGCQFSAQSLVFMLSMLLLGDYVRFIRWDRAGAIVTERVDWRENPEILATFLWRFDRLPSDQRGHDLTVSKPTAKQIRVAKRYLDKRAIFLAKLLGQDEKKARGQYYSSDETFRKFRMMDEDGPRGNRGRFFVASSPQWQSGSPTGRATDGYIAYDTKQKKLVFLKNSWRYLEDGLKKEGDTYKLLEKHKVAGIPKLVCAEDVKDYGTRTHEFSGARWSCKVSEPPSRHRLYRLVLGDIGRPLSKFTSTKQLCSAVRDASKTHAQAYGVGVRHGDISGGNILISDEGKGMLIDWDLSVWLESGVDQTTQTKLRTGTWQFVSGSRLLDIESLRHERHDELESTLHVLLYHSIRYQASKVSLDQFGDLQEAVQTHFESTRKTVEGKTYGGKGKLAYFRIEPPYAFDEAQLHNFLSVPHINLIEELRRLFIPLYATQKSLKLLPVLTQSRDAAIEVLTTSHRFVEIFDEKLEEEEWRDDDASDDLLECDRFLTTATGLVGVTRHSRLKRTSDQASLDNGSAGSAAKRSRKESTPASLPSAVESEEEE